MTTYTVPAAVLDVLGGLQRRDPPVLIWDEDNEQRCCYHPADCSWPKPHCWTKEERIFLPASSAALAAVLARSLGMDPRGGVTFHAACYSGDLEVLELRTVGGCGLNIGIDPDRCDVAVDCLNGLDLDSLYALALAACWVAEDMAGKPHGTWTVETLEAA